eukprot:9430948-Ditylum_brightwellii.AAC.1
MEIQRQSQQRIFSNGKTMTMICSGIGDGIGGGKEGGNMLEKSRRWKRMQRHKKRKNHWIGIFGHIRSYQ